MHKKAIVNNLIKLADDKYDENGYNIDNGEADAMKAHEQAVAPFVHADELQRLGKRIDDLRNYRAGLGGLSLVGAGLGATLGAGAALLGDNYDSYKYRVAPLNVLGGATGYSIARDLGFKRKGKLLGTVLGAAVPTIEDLVGTNFSRYAAPLAGAYLGFRPFYGMAANKLRDEEAALKEYNRLKQVN